MTSDQALTRKHPEADRWTGEISGPGWEGVLGGNCPVQGEGTVDGLPWYFRARGCHWTIDVASTPDGDPVEEGDAFHAGGSWGWGFDASWMEREHAIEIVTAMLVAFRIARKHAPQVPVDVKGVAVQEAEENLLNEGTPLLEEGEPR